MRPIPVSALIFLLLTARLCPAATILLDPGHGGDDNGAVAGSVYFEKQFTLALAEKIAQLLSPGHRIEMTRTSDVTVPIPDRAGMANHLNADLMISLHAAAAPYCNDRNAAVYFHDDERLVFPPGTSAQDRAAGSGADRTRWEKLQAQHQRQSEYVATLIKQSLLDGGEYDDITIGGAPLAALMGANLPAILIEVGCMQPSAADVVPKMDQAIGRHAQSIANAIDLAMSRLGP